MVLPHNGPLLNLVFRKEVFVHHYSLQFSLMICPMHQKEKSRLLSTQMTQKYLTALVRKNIVWHYRPLFQTWNIGIKRTTFALMRSNAGTKISVTRKKKPLQPWWRTPYVSQWEKISWSRHHSPKPTSSSGFQKGRSTSLWWSPSWATRLKCGPQTSRRRSRVFMGEPHGGFFRPG